MSRTRIVKGNITKITGGNYKMFSKENIEFHSNKQVVFNAKEGIIYGEPEKPKLKDKVLSIESELFMHDNQELKIPYINSTKIFNYQSSKPFIAGIRSIFGRDIKHKAAKKLMLDLLNNKLEKPI